MLREIQDLHRFELDSPIIICHFNGNLNSPGVFVLACLCCGHWIASSSAAGANENMFISNVHVIKILCERRTKEKK